MKKSYVFSTNPLISINTSFLLNVAQIQLNKCSTLFQPFILGNNRNVKYCVEKSFAVKKKCKKMHKF
jgi:hypothetical protein